MHELIKRALAENRDLNEYEAKIVLRDFGLETTKEFIAKNVDEALEFANKIGYPVVLKVVSREIKHKTDVGCVKIGIEDEKALLGAYNEILENARKVTRNIEGVLVQEMVNGLEFIVGATIDRTFGKVIMFGLGGVFTEVLKDVSFRILPITKEDAYEMIHEIKARKILEGYRGIKANKEKIVDAIVKVAKLCEKEPIKELDINPLIVNEKEAKVVDALILLER